MDELEQLLSIASGPCQVEWETVEGTSEGLAVLHRNSVVEIPPTHFGPALPGLAECQGEAHMCGLDNGVQNDIHAFTQPPVT